MDDSIKGLIFLSLKILTLSVINYFTSKQANSKNTTSVGNLLAKNLNQKDSNPNSNSMEIICKEEVENILDEVNRLTRASINAFLLKSKVKRRKFKTNDPNYSRIGTFKISFSPID